MFLIFSISGRCCCCSVHLSVLLFSVLCIHFSLSLMHAHPLSLSLPARLSPPSVFLFIFSLIPSSLPPFFQLDLPPSLTHSLFCSRSESCTCRQRERGDERGAHMRIS